MYCSMFHARVVRMLFGIILIFFLNFELQPAKTSENNDQERGKIEVDRKHCAWFHIAIVSIGFVVVVAAVVVVFASNQGERRVQFGV